MKNNVWLYASLIPLLLGACQSSAVPAVPSTDNGDTDKRPASLGIVGDTADVQVKTRGGMVLMGGGRDVDAAFRWMISRAEGGDVVVIRASGTDAYNAYIQDLGKVNSVETLKIDSRALADQDAVAQRIRDAEILFIAGGDQALYRRYWRNTKVSAAIQYLMDEKKAPVGGTSAGCAIMGSIYFSGDEGSITSEQALLNPYDARITLHKDDFLRAPFLDGLVTDQHYITRKRQGRHMAFLARILQDWNQDARGIGVDERTAVCIDDQGEVKVLGSGKAYFLSAELERKPEVCRSGEPLQWVQEKRAVRVYSIQGSAEGNGSFDLPTFGNSAKGGAWRYYWVDQGIQITNQN